MLLIPFKQLPATWAAVFLDQYLLDRTGGVPAEILQPADCSDKNPLIRKLLCCASFKVVRDPRSFTAPAALVGIFVAVPETSPPIYVDAYYRREGGSTRPLYSTALVILPRPTSRPYQTENVAPSEP
jgi:hypothetical protein